MNKAPEFSTRIVNYSVKANDKVLRVELSHPDGTGFLTDEEAENLEKLIIYAPKILKQMKRIITSAPLKGLPFALDYDLNEGSRLIKELDL